MNPQQELIDFVPTKEYFIGIDSDGCVFDSMEPKHKEFFCPNVLRFYGLLPISKIARETWEFVNLYSQQRGINRFLALIACLNLLKEREDVKSRVEPTLLKQSNADSTRWLSTHSPDIIQMK